MGEGVTLRMQRLLSLAETLLSHGYKAVLDLGAISIVDMLYKKNV